ncbi:MAG TPA: polysaccharide deacetylase family protein [Candidatus Acidoferrales bacterium]|nr:polysaccharide deacetylase family protein [Candidatus Acidoferrales bacterium]
MGATGPLTAVAAASAAWMAWAVRGRASSVFAPSIWRGPRDRRAVALTFDDGPSEATLEILEILARHKAAATFFVCGANVERLPEVVRAAARAGHEIGNHSHTHPYLFLRSPGDIEADIRRAQQAIESATGVRPACFRAPYGVRWFGLRAAQANLQLTGVMWTAIGYDWNSGAEEVVARMTAKAANGAILCLHDGRKVRVRPDVRQTVEAVRRLVPMLLDQGYKLETISRLLCPKN